MASCGVALLTSLLLATTACGGGSDADPQPGNPAVYERIESMTDCDELQGEFDIAMDNVERYPAGADQRKAPMAYAKAADERMRNVGCY